MLFYEHLNIVLGVDNLTILSKMSESGYRMGYFI